jgi:membrane protease YdiL (CAAX protease family)
MSWLSETFFLWPMIVPIIIPLIFCYIWKKESLRDVLVIALCMLLIVAFYMFLIKALDIPNIGYTISKFILFVFIPLGIFTVYLKKDGFKDILARFGVHTKGMKMSLLLCLALIPLMLIATTIISPARGAPAPWWFTTIMFFEAFTEEFFFRGIVFLYLWDNTNPWIAGFTSVASFTLLHPQYLGSIQILGPIVQGVLTVIIVWKSKNIVGAWILHGANRVFGLSVLRFLR